MRETLRKRRPPGSLGGSYSPSREKVTETEDGVIIAVMGVTGAGKSSLISLITGRRDIGIGKGLRSETQKVTPYSFKHKGIPYVLVDTPGFNDTSRTDTEILEEIVTWLATKYNEQALLSGIIYLQPISDNRVQGSTMTQLRVFKQLCGKDFYSNVILATTFWGTTDRATAERREEELFSENTFLGDMKDGGSQTARITSKRADALALIQSIAQNQKGVMKVQKELSKTGASLKNTLAAKALSKELVKLSKRFDRRLKVAKRVPLQQKIYQLFATKWRVYKHERAAKALAKANMEREEATFRQNAVIRARVEADAARVQEAQGQREEEVKSKAEREKCDYESRMSLLDRRMNEGRATTKRLREESEMEKYRARAAEEQRGAGLIEVTRKRKEAMEEAINREKRAKQASRNRLSSYDAAWFWSGTCRQPGCGTSLRGSSYWYCTTCGIYVCRTCFNTGGAIYHLSKCQF